MEHNDWKGTTGGTTWMQRSLIGMYRLLPLGLLYGIMALVVPFYMLFSRKGYRAMYAYFRQQRKRSAWQSFWDVYRNHFVFGQIILDRFAFYAGKRFDLSLEGDELVNRQAETGQGFLLLSSHVGNFEMAGYCLHFGHKTLHALVFGGESQTVLRNREKVFKGRNIVMVPVTDDMSHLFILNNALSEGNPVCMPGDRCFGSQKSVECPFIGGTARFPLGPFALSVQREVPVFGLFVMKTGYRSYRLMVRPIQVAEEGLSRRELMAAMTRAFAGELEKVLEAYPHQWFNYYDFWK